MQLIDEKQIVLRGIIINYLQLFVAFASNLILTPIILKHIGRDAYGLWAILNSIMVYFILFDLGLNTSVAKYTAEYRAANRQEDISKVVSTAFTFFIFVAFSVVFISLVLMHFLPSIFKIPISLAEEGKISFLIMGANIAIVIIGGVFGNLIYGHQRVDVWKTCSIIQLVTNAILVIIFLQFNFGLIGLAVASILSSMALVALYLLFIHQAKYEVVINPRLFQTKTFKEIAPYSLRTFVLGISSRVLYYTDPIVIGIFLGPAQVTPYDIVYKLCFLATYPFSIISTSIFPRFTRLFTIGDIDGLRSLYLKVTKLSIFIMLVTTVFLFFWGQDFINLWVGKDNFAGKDVLFLLLIMNFFHGLGTPAIALIQSIGKNKAITRSEVINAIFNLLLSIILVNRMGIVGVVIATLVSHICTSFWVLQLSVFKTITLSFRKYIRYAILPPLLAGFISGMAIWFLKDILPAYNFIYLGLNGIIALLMCFISYIVFSSTREERLWGYRLLKGL